MIKICALSGARAHSLVNANIICTLTSNVVRVTSQECKTAANQKRGKLQNAKDIDEEDDVCESQDEEEGEELQQSQSILTAARKRALTSDAAKHLLQDLSDNITIFFNRLFFCCVCLFFAIMYKCFSGL